MPLVRNEGFESFQARTRSFMKSKKDKPTFTLVFMPPFNGTPLPSLAQQPYAKMQKAE